MNLISKACYVVNKSDLDQIVEQTKYEKIDSVLDRFKVYSSFNFNKSIDRYLENNSVGGEFIVDRAILFRHFAQDGIYDFLSLSLKRKIEVKFADFPELTTSQFHLLIKERKLNSEYRSLKIKQGLSDNRKKFEPPVPNMEIIQPIDKRKRRKKLDLVHNSSWVREIQPRLASLDIEPTQKIIDTLSKFERYSGVKFNRKTIGNQLSFNRELSYHLKEAKVQCELDRKEVALSDGMSQPLDYRSLDHQRTRLGPITFETNQKGDDRYLRLLVSQICIEPINDEPENDILHFEKEIDTFNLPFLVQIHYANQQSFTTSNELYTLEVEPASDVFEIDLNKEAIIPGVYRITVSLLENSDVQEYEIFSLREKLVHYQVST